MTDTAVEFRLQHTARSWFEAGGGTLYVVFAFLLVLAVWAFIFGVREVDGSPIWLILVVGIPVMHAGPVWKTLSALSDPSEQARTALPKVRRALLVGWLKASRSSRTAPH